PPRAPVRSALREVRAEARARAGDLPGARDDLRGALASLPAGAGKSRLWTRMALLASGAEDLVRAAELAELAVAEAGQDAGARAEALSVGAVIDMQGGREVPAHQPPGAARGPV